MKQPDARSLRLAALVAAIAVCLAVPIGVLAQGGSTTHTVFLNLMEVKGGTTADKLAPPSANPADLSKGYAYKGPGAADKNAPQRWEVSSYMFLPAFVTVQQGDRIIVQAFVINGDTHEIVIKDPEGQNAAPKAKWQRGREYRIEFVAAKPGKYELVCSDHAPTMTATFNALPRPR